METIVWPAYINSNHSRKEGRRLSLKESVEEPKIREIRQALRKLKLKYTVEHEKSFPSSWWEQSGRIIVTHEYTTKLELLRKIANTIKVNRVSAN